MCLLKDIILAKVKSFIDGPWAGCKREHMFSQNRGLYNLTVTGENTTAQHQDVELQAALMQTVGLFIEKIIN